MNKRPSGLEINDMFNNDENGALVRPDVSKDSDISKELQSKINWVGMNEIRAPLSFDSKEHGRLSSVASIQAVVSLDDRNAKGIHMSRIFLRVEELSETSLCKESVDKAVSESLNSHEGLSNRAKVEIKLPLMLRRKALLSDNEGWREYPIFIRAEKSGNEMSYSFGIRFTYSSTCPCSAALARQIIQNNFKNKFTPESLDYDEVVKWIATNEAISATPHSQRSHCDFWFNSEDYLEIDDLIRLIDGIEDVLKTPVQSAVKREDEQEFARLNGTYPLFVEDSIRKISNYVDNKTCFKDFKKKNSSL